MRDPVIANCGHTFERLEVEGWRAEQVSQNRDPNCPLCRNPLGGLVQNRLVADAIAVINATQDAFNPVTEDAFTTTITSLTDDERTVVQNCIQNLRARQNEDQRLNIPTRLEEPRSFIQRAIDRSAASCGQRGNGESSCLVQ